MRVTDIKKSEIRNQAPLINVPELKVVGIRYSTYSAFPLDGYERDIVGADLRGEEGEGTLDSA